MSAHERVIYSYFFAYFIFAIKISSIFSVSYCQYGGYEKRHQMFEYQKM